MYQRKESLAEGDYRMNFDLWDEEEDFDELKECQFPIFVQFSTLDCDESKKLGKKLAQLT